MRLAGNQVWLNRRFPRPGGFRYNQKFNSTTPGRGIWRRHEANKSGVFLDSVDAGRSVTSGGRRGSGAEPTASKRIDFNYQIRPILSDKCFNCHGPDPRKRKAGLRLDTKDGAFAKLKSDGHAIVPGNLDESELVAQDHGRG